MKPIALVDMDGTIADYAGAMIDGLLKLRNPDEILGDLEYMEKTPYMKARMDLIKRQPDWWLNLKPIKKGFEIVDMLKNVGYRIHILTKGPRNDVDAWTQKAKWCRKWIPDAELTITLDKSIVYGKVLVDDWPEYIKGWLEQRPRGLVIMPDQPWNQKFQHPQVVRATSNLTLVYEAIIRHYRIHEESRNV